MAKLIRHGEEVKVGRVRPEIFSIPAPASTGNVKKPCNLSGPLAPPEQWGGLCLSAFPHRLICNDKGDDKKDKGSYKCKKFRGKNHGLKCTKPGSDAY